MKYFDREEQGDTVEMIDHLDRAQVDTSVKDTDKGATKRVQRRRRRRKTATGAEPAHATE